MGKTSRKVNKTKFTGIVSSGSLTTVDQITVPQKNKPHHWEKSTGAFRTNKKSDCVIYRMPPWVVHGMPGLLTAPAQRPG